jgi:hypothetical protein
MPCSSEASTKRASRPHKSKASGRAGAARIRYALISSGSSVAISNVSGGISNSGRFKPRWSLTAKFDREFARGAQTYAGTGMLRFSW